MGKIVRYNGGTISYYGCSKPTELIIGKQYEVIKEEKRDVETYYTLKGVKGYFNSHWFDDVPSAANTFMAVAYGAPSAGKRYELSKLEFVNGQPKLIRMQTSTVKEVLYLGNNIYRVTTCNSIYIVQVE